MSKKPSKSKQPKKEPSTAPTTKKWGTTKMRPNHPECSTLEEVLRTHYELEDLGKIGSPQTGGWIALAVKRPEFLKFDRVSFTNQARQLIKKSKLRRRHFIYNFVLNFISI